MNHKKLLILFLMIAGMVAITACQSNTMPKDASHYTCPMHPKIKMDTKGQCPICGMDLVPVNTSSNFDHSEHNHGKTNAETRTIQINPRYVQNIGVLTETVQKRVLVRNLPAYGKVAHDHKLWVAQNEYIESLKLGDANLIKASERKLKFLGLSDNWINTLKKNRSADITLHLETIDKPTYFEAFIYQEDISLVKEGLKVTIQDQKGRFLSNGKVKSIGTLVDLKSRSIRVLVESDTSLNLKLNTFIQVKIEVPLGEKLSVHKEAILFNGSHMMVYVAKGNGTYEPRTIEVGQKSGNYYEITSGLKDGETVVTNGHFLIDSESQIKMGGMKGHQH